MSASFGFVCVAVGDIAVHHDHVDHRQKDGLVVFAKPSAGLERVAVKTETMLIDAAHCLVVDLDQLWTRHRGRRSVLLLVLKRLAFGAAPCSNEIHRSRSIQDTATSSGISWHVAIL